MELVLLLAVVIAGVVALAFWPRRKKTLPSAPPASVPSEPSAPAQTAVQPLPPAAPPSPLEQAFAQSADNPIYELSVEAGTLTWNQAFYKVFGYNKSEQANTSEWWATHIHPEDAMQVNERMDKLLDPSSTGWEVSYRFKKADGTYVPVTDHVLIRRNADGEAQSLLGTMQVQDTGTASSA
jgi:PAS domain S-box-containing protein